MQVGRPTGIRYYISSKPSLSYSVVTARSTSILDDKSRFILVVTPSLSNWWSSVVLQVWVWKFLFALFANSSIDTPSHDTPAVWAEEPKNRLMSDLDCGPLKKNLC